jgi:hypothetical protein
VRRVLQLIGVGRILSIHSSLAEAAEAAEAAEEAAAESAAEAD